MGEDLIQLISEESVILQKNGVSQLSANFSGLSGPTLIVIGRMDFLEKAPPEAASDSEIN